MIMKGSATRRLAVATLGGVIVVALPLMTAAPVAAKPSTEVKPPLQAYVAPAAAAWGKHNPGGAAEAFRPLTLAQKRPTRQASGGPSVNVIGGGAASIGEYPYYVSIWRQGLPICGGSLLSVTQVLTAANCVDDGAPLSLFQLRIGGTQLSGTDSGVIRGILKADVHPGWVPMVPIPPTPPSPPTPPAAPRRYDVAVLTLSSPITRADATVQWLRLAQGNELGLVDVGDLGTVIGNGGPSGPQNQLMELTVPIRPDTPSTDPLLMFAGGTAAGGQGLCRMDEGAPLVITTTPQHLQIGNVDWYPSSPCGRPNSPEVYSELYQGALPFFVNSLVARPANDQFTSPVVLNGNAGSVAGNNTNATLDPGETGSETSVWYQWKPTETGTARVTVNQHGFDSEVGVYTGSGVTALTLVAANDNANGTLQSQVEFPVVKGKIYQIRVDGFQFDFGPFQLSYAVSRAANDDFASAAPIADTCVCPVVASNTNATGQAGELNVIPGDGDATLWYSWTASAAGVARFTTAGSGFVATLAAYTGTTLTGLTQLVADGDADGETNSWRQALITFEVFAPGTYRIRVGSVNGARGNLRLQHALDPAPNDLFVQPQVLAGTSGYMTGSNTRALSEPGEPAFLLNPTSTVWYRWTAPVTAKYEFTTLGSNFDTKLAAMTGSTITTLALVVFNDDAIELLSRIEFQATGGVTYWIWVDGYASSDDCEKGDIQLNWIKL